MFLIICQAVGATSSEGFLVANIYKIHQHSAMTMAYYNRVSIKWVRKCYRYILFSASVKVKPVGYLRNKRSVRWFVTIVEQLLPRDLTGYSDSFMQHTANLHTRQNVSK